MEKKVPKNSNVKVTRQASQEKVAKILQSIGQLFQPFKDVLVNVLPSSKWVIKVLDFIGKSIAQLILLIAKLIPLIFSFLKGKAFKIIIIVVLLVVVFNTIASRIINNVAYKNMLAKAIGDATGYHTIIEGRVSVNLLLLSLTIDNAAFYSPISKGEELALNLLSVNHLKINFAFLPIFVGDLKAKKVDIKRAEIRYKFISSQSDEDKFISLASKLDEVTNIRMVLPKEVKVNNQVNDSARFIEELSNLENNGAVINKNKETIIDNKPLADNYKKYLNLKEVFAPKTNTNTPVFVNVDNNNLLYKFLTKLSAKLTFSLASLNSLSFSNVLFKLIDNNNKPVFTIENLSGELIRKFMGGHTLTGEGMVLNRDMFFLFQDKAGKNKDEFSLVASYENSNFKTKDLVISGSVDKDNKIEGNIIFSGSVFKTLITQIFSNHDFLDAKNSSLETTFNYEKSLLALPNINFIVNGIKNNGSVLYNFRGDGIVEAKLDLSLSNLDTFFNNFAAYKKDKPGTTFSNFNDIMLEWQTNKHSFMNPKFFAINLQINNTSINSVPLSKFAADVFLDNNDNFYINNIELEGNNISAKAKGKIQLVNKSGTLIVNSKGSINSLCSYTKCSNNLDKFLMSVSGNQNNYNLITKVFLNDNRLVFNDINGNIGNKLIKDTNATLVERSGGSDLLISSKLDNIDFADFYNIYYFNKDSGRLYYNTNNEITGIPSNLIVHLNLYSDNFNFKGLSFNNFQMESSIVSSGILIHNFSFNVPGSTGNISGSFNFNDKVSPSIVGNIDFYNVLLKAEDLHKVFFSNYKIAGKVVVNGNIHVSGDNYYNGINRVNGNLSLIKYERLKINKENKTPGFYLTLMKLPYQGSNYYQIGDLYGNISIYNNVIEFAPAIVRYIDGKKNYRGSFSGGLNLLRNQFDLQGILNSENSKDKFNFTVNGDLLNAIVK